MTQHGSPEFVAQSVEFGGALTVGRAPDAAFPLFSPLGEIAWVPSWSPELIHPPGVAWARGMVFRTRDEKGEAVWIVTALDRAAHEVEYHRVEPGRYVARIRVRCEAAAAGRTLVSVTYAFIGLSEDGNAEIARMSAGEFEDKMRRWERWIAALPQDCSPA